jgi:peptide/nickel transport system ATP-binding protein
MYAGNMVEYGTAEQIFASRSIPTRMGLLASLPRLDDKEQHAAGADRRPAAEPAAPAARLRVCAALQVPHADLRHARAALRFRRRSRRALLLSTTSGPKASARCRSRPRRVPKRLRRRAPLVSPTADLVEVRDLYKYFPINAGVFSRHVGDVKAVDGVDFTIRRARRSGSSASPARAKRRPAASCCACCRRPRAR